MKFIFLSAFATYQSCRKHLLTRKAEEENMEIIERSFLILSLMTTGDDGDDNQINLERNVDITRVSLFPP